MVSSLCLRTGRLPSSLPHQRRHRLVPRLQEDRQHRSSHRSRHPVHRRPVRAVHHPHLGCRDRAWPLPHPVVQHRPPDRSYRLEPGQATAPQSPGLPRQPSRRRPTGPCSRDTTPSDRPTLLRRARASAHARMQQRRQTPCRSSTAVWLRAKHDPGAPVDKREPSRANRLLLNIMVTVLLAPVIRDRHTQNSSATS